MSLFRHNVHFMCVNNLKKPQNETSFFFHHLNEHWSKIYSIFSVMSFLIHFTALGVKMQVILFSRQLIVKDRTPTLVTAAIFQTAFKQRFTIDKQPWLQLIMYILVKGILHNYSTVSSRNMHIQCYYKAHQYIILSHK